LSEEAEVQGLCVDVASLPASFPTHRHSGAFWEALGRAVGTFGFLEEILGRAIFALTATRQYGQAEIVDAYYKWLAVFERALSDPLGGLIVSFESAARGRVDASGLASIVQRLKNAAKMRNLLCHASWNRPPDDRGRSVPFFIAKNMEYFDAPIDLNFLNQVQRQTAELACAVMQTVTEAGYQFPGSNGPGKPVW
jgi:hypothetical protein